MFKAPVGKELPVVVSEYFRRKQIKTKITMLQCVNEPDRTGRARES